MSDTPNFTFDFTPSAAQRIADILKSQNQSPDTHFFRLGVDGGGCSGFQYTMDIDDTLSDDDFIFETNGIRMVIDPMSSQYLNGGSLDFQQSLGGSVLKVNNPNSTSSCGCGQSFDI